MQRNLFSFYHFFRVFELHSQELCELSECIESSDFSFFSFHRSFLASFHFLTAKKEEKKLEIHFPKIQKIQQNPQNFKNQSWKLCFLEKSKHSLSLLFNILKKKTISLIIKLE